uniref:Uncharacterized protein n=1 Tax=Panagrolaimus sp. ES5 TaxID=591445 RepID=A0AC34G3K4_9BILA
MNNLSLLDNVKPRMINGKIVWAGAPSMMQYFNLPESIIYYMAMNPSTPEVYQKLIQCCKYFFEKNPILVAVDMDGKTKICSNDAATCRKKRRKCCIDIDMKKVSCNIWVTDTICLTNENISIFSSLIFPKLYRWKMVHLYSHCSDVLYNEFKSCASFLTEIDFFMARIINDDGSMVMLDKILEDTPNIKTFKYSFGHDLSMINAATMKNICELKNLKHLKTFILSSLPDVLNVEDISTFIKDHPDTTIWLHHSITMSEEYKTQLDALVDTVIESEVPNRLIYYTGVNKEKYKTMEKFFQV